MALTVSAFGECLDELARTADSQVFASLVPLASEASDSELARLAQVLGESGDRYFPEDRANCVDLASTGGPSSLSTLVCPLVQRMMGFRVPKVGVPGRPAGGIDVLGTIPGYETSLSHSDLVRVMQISGYAHVEAKRFAPLDGQLFRYRRDVGAVANPALAIASLLSKKIAVGLGRAGLEVRVSPHGNFGTDWEAAHRNGQRFRNVAALAGIETWVVLTDASLPFQPYIGRGEALLALDDLFDGKEQVWLSQHFAECVSMTSGIALRPTRPEQIDRQVLRQIFASNLEAQGSDIAAFDARVSNLRQEHYLDITADEVMFRVDDDLLDGIASFASNANCTTFQVLLAGFKIMASRVSERRDQSVAVGVSGRHLPGTDRTVGYFANYLLVRSEIHEAMTIADVVRSVRDAAAEACDNQDVPLINLLGEIPELTAWQNDLIDPGRERSLGVLVQYMSSAGLQPLGFPGATVTPIDGCRGAGASPFDLHVRFAEGDELTCRFIYTSALFDAVTIERYVDSYLAVLEEVVADPHAFAVRSPTPELSPDGRQLAAAVRAMVADVLGVDESDIDVDDPIARLGLDSLDAVELLDQIEGTFNVQLPEDALDDRPSITDLVRLVVDDFDATQMGTLVRRERQRSEIDLAARLAAAAGMVDAAIESDSYFYHAEIEEPVGAWGTIGDQRMLIATSYSYLGLMDDERIRSAARSAIDAYGTGSHGSRLLAGTTPEHRLLEAELADFLQAEDAVLFSSGFVTNVAVLTALTDRNDVIITDELNHASLAAGSRYSGATVLTYAHNDMADLAECLDRAVGATTLVVADGVFSMSGTVVPLPEVVELCQRRGAHLMVDEAHSFGVMGATGRGIAEHFGVEPKRIDIRMGTLSKALPSTGGFVVGSRELVRTLRHSAEGYIFSGALTPVHVAAARTALEILRNEPELTSSLRAKAKTVRDALRASGLEVLGDGSPIVPVVFSDADRANAVTKRCQAAGVFVLPVVYPAVPLDAPRLRLSITNDLSESDVDLLVHTVVDAARAEGELPVGAQR